MSSYWRSDWIDYTDRTYTKYFVFSLGIFTSYNHIIYTSFIYPLWQFSIVAVSSSEYVVFLSVYSPECLTNAMLDIQQSHLENCRTPARSHSSASLPYAEIKKSQGTCKPEHGRVASYTSSTALPPDHHLSWLVAAAVQIMAKQTFWLAPDSWHERCWTQTPTQWHVHGHLRQAKGAGSQFAKWARHLKQIYFGQLMVPAWQALWPTRLAGNAASSSSSTRLVLAKVFSFRQDARS